MKKIIAIDGDGVLFDYNAVYPIVWKKAFGETLSVVNPNSYHAIHEYGVSFTSEVQEQKFFDAFDSEVWSAMPALRGAIEATRMLFSHGYSLVCVSSMPEKFTQARLHNLHALWMPFDRVIATGRDEGGGNPKQAVIAALKPVFFVDDLIGNFEGVPSSTHNAWIDYKKLDSPSLGQVSEGWHDSTHGSLLDFAKWVIQTDKSLAGKPD